ncbi:MAG: hypothetical protein WBF90_29460 [Rivularia sp. (in: cyanobacteria)]
MTLFPLFAPFSRHLNNDGFVWESASAKSALWNVIDRLSNAAVSS